MTLVGLSRDEEYDLIAYKFIF